MFSFAENSENERSLTQFMEKYSSYIFLLNQGRSTFFKRDPFIREDETFCFVWFRTQLVRVTQRDFYKNWRLLRLLSIFELLVKQIWLNCCRQCRFFRTSMARTSMILHNSPHNWSLNCPPKITQCNFFRVLLNCGLQTAEPAEPIFFPQKNRRKRRRSDFWKI